MRSVFFKAGVCTLAGGMLAFPLAAVLPQKFSVETRLKIEAASERAIGDALAALHSKRSLDNLVHALNLGRGSEFAIDRSSMTSVVSDIVSGDAMTVSQAEGRLRDRLSRAIATGYDGRKGELVISVTAAEADDAASIANMLGDAFRNELAVSGAGIPNPLAEKLRQTLERAEAALAGFISETDPQKLAELRRAESERRELATEITNAEGQLVDFKRKAAEASAMKPDDVLNKPLPDSLDYTGIDYQRQRYVEAKLAVDQLSGDLGPRHPRLLAAQSALDGARSGIQMALKQLATSLRQEEAAATGRLSELKSRQSKKLQDKEIVDSAARLAVLEAAVDEARRSYLDASHRTTEVRTPAAKVTLLAPATVERARAHGFSLPGMFGAGALIGLCLGLVLAFVTRRKQADAPVDDVPMEAVEEPVSAAEQDWPENVSEQEEVFEEDSGLPDYEPAYEQEQYLYTPRYPAPANDRPLADHIREVLMANRRPAREADIPPLVAAAMSGGLAAETRHRTPYLSEENIRRAEEVRELQRHIVELREKVQVYSVRRNAARR
ncbi:hypothetical protein ACFFP0_15150 [Rhizobium puerariae]|uniref:Succinoglycan biosynthesis protein exop n=1 Tax=Rhizobium puerariae TaxID=1585791 RepID=A0ABV6ALL6_9HYPH